jgi:hypothetical protein
MKKKRVAKAKRLDYVCTGGQEPKRLAGVVAPPVAARERAGASITIYYDSEGIVWCAHKQYI